MAFERRFNAIRFYSKLNHFVLSPRKKAEPFRFKNSSEWFCGLYICLLIRKLIEVLKGCF